MNSSDDNLDATSLRRRLRALADPAIAAHSQRFFRTGPGEYGEGDRFLGIRVPVLRKETRRVRGMPLGEIRQLLESPWHEERLCALLTLADDFERGDEVRRQAVFELCLSCLDRIDNWDLVDLCGPRIVGPWLEQRDRGLLFRWVESPSLWERRIAVLATFHFIRQNDFADTLRLAERLLQDPEDLIHKAVGWMLREVGNRDRPAEEAFLLRHYREMPRTMLRYAIEKFPEDRRQAYLKGAL